MTLTLDFSPLIFQSFQKYLLIRKRLQGSRYYFLFICFKSVSLEPLNPRPLDPLSIDQYLGRCSLFISEHIGYSNLISFQNVSAWKPNRLFQNMAGCCPNHFSFGQQPDETLLVISLSVYWSKKQIIDVKKWHIYCQISSI